METKIYHYSNSKKVVMEVFDNPVGWFDCISDVARKFGHSITTITSRIQRGSVINGVRIRFPKEGEDLSSIPYLSPPKEYGKIRKPKSAFKVGRPEKPVKPLKQKPEPKEVELDREKYNIIRYEVRNLFECITPCPYMLSPKTMVGSFKCQKCFSFKGINRKTHEVACKRHYYK